VGSSGPPASPPPPNPVAELSYGIESPAPSNWNVLSAGGDGFASVQIADQVWPSAFDVGPNYVPVVNTNLLSSAQETSRSPEVVVYHINPKAAWSDGVAVSGADFAYNWQAQSGRAEFRDVGGRPFTPATTEGYADIESVEVAPSAPDTVVVRFSQPYADWQSLFSHLAPAHVARRVGFDKGFTDPVADLVSAGPFLVQSYVPGVRARLVRNPSYTGVPAGSLELDFRFVPDPNQLESALAAGQLSCASVEATAAALSPLRSMSSLTVKVTPGPSYLDLDFREGSGLLASEALRVAASDAVNRAAVVAASTGRIDPRAAPVLNRFFVPAEPGYVAQAPPPPAPGQAEAGGGEPLRLVFGTDPLSESVAGVVLTGLRAAGFDVTAEQVAFVPAALRAGRWDAAIEERPLTPFPGSAVDAYLSGSPADVDGFASSAVDSLVHLAATTSGAARLVDIDRIDRAAWQDHVDLPLVAVPTAVACQTQVTGAGPNPAPQGPAYNAATWGVSGST
jgi:peptide/nickel transport system substrate-binding protein